MFDEFGPHGAEEEREELWTDLSEVPDEQYNDCLLYTSPSPRDTR